MTEQTVDYQKTLNLPKTDFSMKADLVKKEPLIRQKWEKEDLYHQIIKKNKDKTKYILHDGPPYANGDVHVGTALNKILKDIVVKFKAMQGYYAPFVPGWDCHGLPIEHRVMNPVRSKSPEGTAVPTLSERTSNGVNQMSRWTSGKDATTSQIREECEKYARRYIEIQRRQFQSLGVLGEWHNPYLTLDPSYESAVIEVFSDLVKKGFIYRKLKPIHWCMHCETALAEAELEYADEKGPSVYVKFPIVDTTEMTQKLKTPNSALRTPHSFFIWTTTPWTLPANVAVAVHPDLEYAFVEYTNADTKRPEVLIFAEGLVEKVMKLLGINDYKVLFKLKGAKLENLQYEHPFIKRTCQVILADYVRLEDGTGVVHTAPGHGIEDYESGLKYNLPVLSPVDSKGRFTTEAQVFEGVRVWDADDKICQMLKDSGHLLLRQDMVHSYPHCWRCKKPVIFRSTEQWFISVDNHSARLKALEEVKKVRWVPEWGQSRISSMLEQRPDWCISRQRQWGVPIPVFYCTRCHEPLLDGKVIDFVKELFRKQGANSWFTKPTSELMPPDTKCNKCGGGEFTKEKDIFDVWFESGSSFRAVVIENNDLQFPADLYLEGTDQHRGWFQLSLLPSVMTRSEAPFKTVLTHGFVKTPEGDKISKSKGDLLLSDEMVSKVGADIIRLWIASIDFTDDIPVSMEILEEKADPYRKIRNTFRYMLGNLYDFSAEPSGSGGNPKTDLVKYSQLWEIDRWALNKLHRLIKDVTLYYDNFEFYRVFREIYEFCVVEMSAFYFDVLKDRLYTFAKDSPDRRVAQTALYEILTALVRIIAPILSFTAEEIWSHIRGINPKLEPSVHLSDFPEVDNSKIDQGLEERWQKILQVRSEVAREIEKLRKEDKIGSSIEADVKLYSDGAGVLEFLRTYEKDLPMLLKVSSIKVIEKKVSPVTGAIQMSVEITKSGHQKCQRCWNYTESVGKNPSHPALCSRCIAITDKY
ncbi:MAG: isoleucine--tRNA ligase [Planctomycetota bacterium]|nr:isoleucine--tRNA ligase [Planctomycetota bacterium]MDI6786991.1 isoleucine--tRNA ligase [Planctomycetota bacterium]